MTRLRDDARRLSLANYPSTIQMRPAFCDMDAFRHLNNVALMRFLEEGRASFNALMFGADSVIGVGDATQFWIASITVDYVGQGEYPGMIDVATGISSLGNSSFGLRAALFQNGRCIVLAESSMVHAVDGAPCRLPDDLRARMEPYLAAQAH